MLAARLYPGEDALRLEEVPVPTPAGDQVLVRVAGAGVCRSDLHVLDGPLRGSVRPPVTMGHEIAGRVAAVGPAAGGVELGEAVVVMVGWGCGHCEWCVAGYEQLCPDGDEAGATLDGGFAEYVLVPHRRHVVALEELDPRQAAPLGCAGLCAYAAVKRVRGRLQGGSACVVVGVGGLGRYAIQLARLMTGATVIAVDADESRLALARSLGAEHAVSAGPDAADALLELTRGRGAEAVIDLVGSGESLALATASVRRRGIVALLGLSGGTVPFGFYELAPEAVLTTVVAGTGAELREVVGLARAHDLEVVVHPYPLERVGDALDDLRAGRLEGRAVVTP